MEMSPLIKTVTIGRVETCLRTIESICMSPELDQYLIGFTSLSAAGKGDSYRRISFEHFVILADRMTCDAALDLETRIQSEILGGWSTLLQKKYHAEKRINKRLYKSSGGLKHDGKACSVYMAWWDS